VAIYRTTIKRNGCVKALVTTRRLYAVITLETLLLTKLRENGRSFVLRTALFTILFGSGKQTISMSRGKIKSVAHVNKT
jgi:hypothetical protein